jgi:hypothetical protein
LPAEAQIDAGGMVRVPTRLLGGGPERLLVRAENLAGWSTREIALELPPTETLPTIPATGLGSAWMASHGLTGCVRTGDSSDGDGYCLATEYAFGLDPTRPDVASHALRLAGGYLTIEWNALNTGATYTVEQSTNLHDWTAVPNLSPARDLGEVGTHHRRKSVSLIRSGEMKFYRVTAEFAEPAAR